MSILPKSPQSAFTIDYSQRKREIITKCKIKNRLEDSPPLEGSALWDTGATSSVVSKSFAKKLQLKPIRRGKIQDIHGHRTVDVYLADIWLSNEMTYPGWNFLENDIVGKVDVLIGMDIIGNGDFSICGGRVFSFALLPVETPMEF